MSGLAKRQLHNFKVGQPMPITPTTSTSFLPCDDPHQPALASKSTSRPQSERDDRFAALLGKSLSITHSGNAQSALNRAHVWPSRKENDFPSNSHPPSPRWIQQLPGPRSSPEEFRVRHKLVSIDKFRRLAERLHLDASFEAGGNLRAEDMVRMADRGFTRNIHDCTSVIMQNGDHGSLGHFIPTDDNLASDDIDRAIRKDITALGPRGRAISTLIIGGHSDDAASRAMHAKVQTSVASTRRAVSEIWGAKPEINTMEHSDDEDGDIESRPRIQAMFDARKQTNYLSLDGIDEIHSLKGLAYWYDTFHIAPPDAFEAQGKLYTADEANSAYAHYRNEFKRLAPNTIVTEEELNASAPA